MKALTLTKLLAAAMVLTASYPALAGTRDAGGGTGIMMDGKLIVLDLVEAGVEANPFVPSLTPSANIVKALEQNLRAPQEFKDEIIPALAAKLTDIEQEFPMAGMYMAGAYSVYEIKLTNLKLNEIDDTDSAIGEPKIQIAERKGSQIWINRQRWSQLDMANKVALMVHEIVYAFQPAPAPAQVVESGGTILTRGYSYTVGGTESDGILATSAKARYLTGFFFRPDWHSTWTNELQKEMTAGDAGVSFSYLYDFFVEAIGSKSRVSGFQVGKADPDQPWNTDEVGKLKPTFSQLEITALRGRNSKDLKLVLKASHSLKEVTALCQKAAVRAEMVPTYSSFLLSSIRTGERADEKIDTNYSVKLMDRSNSRVELSNSRESRFGPNSFAIYVTGAHVDGCVKQLRQIQKQDMR